MNFKKLWTLFLLFCLLFVMSGCASTSMDTNSKIVSPENYSIPLQGQWRIEECLNGDQKSMIAGPDSRWLNKTAEFTWSFAAIGEHYWENVNYKIKRVDAAEYFLHKYKNPLEKLGIKNKEIYVITLSSNDKFLYEFIKLDENKVIANIEDELYCLVKVSNKVDDRRDEEIIKTEEKEEENSLLVDELLRSGLLLGIRTPASKTDKAENPDEPEEFNYRTLWIASVNRELHPVLEADDIFLPRMSGFWKVEVKKTVEAKRIEDILLAYSISDINSRYQFIASLNPNFWNDREGILHKKILYVGNDYISVENSGKGKIKSSAESWQESRLQTLPVDKISNTDGVKISDIAGEDGKLAIENALEGLLSSSNAKGIKETGLEKQEESFALFRKTGHWSIKGRLNFEKNDLVSFSDYNINLIPPAELVAYDVLHLPWTYFKDKIPNAIDAYTSPNKDIAVVLTRDQLFIYAINAGGLAESPLKKIRLEEGDSVVMAEWALADYMESWEKIFKKNNRVRVIDDR